MAVLVVVTCQLKPPRPGSLDLSDIMDPPIEDEETRKKVDYTLVCMYIFTTTARKCCVAW